MFQVFNYTEDILTSTNTQIRETPPTTIYSSWNPIAKDFLGSKTIVCEIDHLSSWCLASEAKKGFALQELVSWINDTESCLALNAIKLFLVVLGVFLSSCFIVALGFWFPPPSANAAGRHHGRQEWEATVVCREISRWGKAHWLPYGPFVVSCLFPCTGCCGQDVGRVSRVEEDSRDKGGVVGVRKRWWGGRRKGGNFGCGWQIMCF